MAVTLQEAIAELEAGDWVQLRFLTADVNKGTGGQVIEIAKCRIARNRQPAPSPVKRDGSDERTTGITKDPSHNLHFTRNLELPNKQVRKFHPILMTHINHQPVI